MMGPLNINFQYEWWAHWAKCMYFQYEWMSSQDWIFLFTIWMNEPTELKIHTFNINEWAHWIVIPIWMNGLTELNITFPIWMGGLTEMYFQYKWMSPLSWIYILSIWMNGPIKMCFQISQYKRSSPWHSYPFRFNGPIELNIHITNVNGWAH